MLKTLRIVSVYNRYLKRGGEDEVFEAEARLLEQRGSQVIYVTEHVRNPSGINEKLATAFNVLWSKKWYEKFRVLLKEQSPNVAHFHNTFPIISPSAYSACREVGVPVVQTLHNYRLLCPRAILYRNENVCEDCLGKTPPWPGVLHACYRSSRAQSAVVASMLTIHRGLRTWQKKVDVYIALTEFARRKFIEGGLPAEKIIVKPNFIHPDPGECEDEAVGDYALFVGRLSPEKGLRTLLRAWKQLKNIPLKIAGDGPLLEEAQSLISEQGLVSNVEIMGRRTHEEVLSSMKRARFLVFPSEWYETFGLSTVEAFACGVPVIASRLGAMSEIIKDERTGLHFTPGDADDLAAKVEWAWAHTERMREMGREARAEYEARYTADKNYQMLMDIYQKAIEAHKEK